MKNIRKPLVLFLITAVLLVMTSCGKAKDTAQSGSSAAEGTASAVTTSEAAFSEAASSEATSSAAEDSETAASATSSSEMTSSEATFSETTSSEATSSETTSSEAISSKAATSEESSSGPTASDENPAKEKTPSEESNPPSEESNTPPEEAEPPAKELEEEVSYEDVCILFTGDIHFYVNDGFGLTGLETIRNTLESKGYKTILVDNGDAIQGSAVGKISKGETMIELMNSLHYDVAIPGNHEFDYGMDQFLKFTEMADFPYISCNFNKKGELVFDPYTIIEAGGRKIGFVGVTTPTTLESSKPAYFKNENGEDLYGFLQGDNGEELYQAVQSAVDAARAEGADYVYLMAHLGLNEKDHPFTFSDVIAHTNGIDAVLDAHSHESERLIVNNKDGDPVTRCACGAKLSHIGYSFIPADQRIMTTNIWKWPDDASPHIPE